MATAGGRSGGPVSDALLREPYRFDFFQAVRLLERLQRDRSRRPAKRGERDPRAEEELLRFRTQPSLSFPPSAISDIRRAAGDDGNAPLEMTVAFLGLAGSLGVMPHHYTALLLERVRNKDYSLRDFLDLFNHRLVSLFYRAWRKYRLPFAYERAALDGPGEVDTCTRALYCLVGLGTRGLRGRQKIEDEAFVYYGGHFAHWPRSAIALEAMLEDYFAVPVHVEQLHGQWLLLSPGDRSLMPGGRDCPDGRNCQLGLNVIAGERIWDVQSKFRLRLGPLTYQQFRSLMPNGDALRPLAQMTRTYVGLEFDFDVQLVLIAAEVPWCRLGPGEDAPHLGWNTWIRGGEFAQDVTDAVFRPEEV
jgi:type VI secretion system protein ImpH